MAIKRLNPKAIFKIVSQYDDAVDIENIEELKTGVIVDGVEETRPTRYEQYIESDFDEAKLKYKEGMQPDRFLLRAITADELASINSKYLYIDTVAKKVTTLDRNSMFLSLFKLAYSGIESADKVVSKPSTDEFPYNVQVEMGSIVSLITSLNKNEKK